jgi:hypothetical protein
MQSDAKIYQGAQGAYVTEATVTLDNRREVAQLVKILGNFAGEFEGVLPDEIELANDILDGLSIPDWMEAEDA